MAIEKRKVKPATSKLRLILSMSWCPSKGNPRHEFVYHGAWPEDLETSSGQSSDESPYEDVGTSAEQQIHNSRDFINVSIQFL